MNIQQRELTLGTYEVRVNGPLTTHLGEQLGRNFQDLFVRGVERVVVNLADAPFMDGPGLAALLTGYKLFRGYGRSFQLANLQDQPQLVLQVTGFNRIFDLVNPVVEAEMVEWTRPAWSGYRMAAPATALVDMAA